MSVFFTLSIETGRESPIILFGDCGDNQLEIKKLGTLSVPKGIHNFILHSFSAVGVHNFSNNIYI